MDVAKRGNIKRVTQLKRLPRLNRVQVSLVNKKVKIQDIKRNMNSMIILAELISILNRINKRSKLNRNHMINKIEMTNKKEVIIVLLSK